MQLWIRDSVELYTQMQIFKNMKNYLFYPTGIHDLAVTIWTSDKI